MKKVILVFIISLFILSCSNKNTIIGIWRSAAGLEMQFTTTGDLIATLPNGTINVFAYEAKDGDGAYWTTEPIITNRTPFAYTFKDGQMVLRLYSNNISATFKRIK